ncbi:MAG: Stp1/IreP family PP2C-type Ser/Thr phosphatase [Lachnospiraceae bacterium]|nr:Stp1/IreP family PP2C-type Ser/Thr phosphatase [Lachnospiraceae bacterium]
MRTTSEKTKGIAVGGKTVLRSFSVTDIGKKRKLNQDYVYVSETSVGNLPNVFIVADGMGGHNAGDYASKCTVETMVREIRGCFEKNPVRILGKAVMAANDQIRRKAKEDSKLYGMGSTVVAATCLGHYLQVANVGDSRLYIINDEIRQITRDHSLVEEMVRMGGLDRAAARNHPDKNIITRAIGALDTVEIDFFHEELRPGDIVLMCSDGLTNMLEDNEISEIVKEYTSLEERAEKLVEAANRNGGKDNIAVILINVFAKE